MTMGSVKKEIKYLQDWIQWHLDDDRAECIFQAARDHDGIRGHGDDTNAQEGCGKWIKRGFGPKGSKPSLDECIQYIFHLVLQVQRDINQETLGKRTRYGKKTNPIERSAAKIKKRKAKKRINDGRPPDTTDILIPPSKTRTKSLGAHKQGGVGSRP